MTNNDIMLKAAPCWITSKKSTTMYASSLRYNSEITWQPKRSLIRQKPVKEPSTISSPFWTDIHSVKSTSGSRVNTIKYRTFHRIHVHKHLSKRASPPFQRVCKQTRHDNIHGLIKFFFVNDPSAGSPTETLLRLHLPLSDKVYTSSRQSNSNERNCMRSRGFTGPLNR